MGIGTKGVHVSELKYKTCPARWIYFCVGVFHGFMSGCADVRFASVAGQRPELDAAAHARLRTTWFTLNYSRCTAEDLIACPLYTPSIYSQNPRLCRFERQYTPNPSFTPAPSQIP